MNTIIEKIRAFVEREKEKQMDIWRDSTSEDALGMALDKISVYNQILSILSDLEKEEKPTTAEGLEEEYKDYVESDPVYSKLVNRNAGLSIARHFAKWGAEHRGSSETPNDLEKAAEEYATGLNLGGYVRVVDAFKAGAEWQKEKMMSEAVEVKVQPSPLNGPLGISAYCCNFPSKHPFYRCKEGDKVKLIIVKED